MSLSSHIIKKYGVTTDSGFVWKKETTKFARSVYKALKSGKQLPLL